MRHQPVPLIDPYAVLGRVTWLLLASHAASSRGARAWERGPRRRPSPRWSSVSRRPAARVPG